MKTYYSPLELFLKVPLVESFFDSNSKCSVQWCLPMLVNIGSDVLTNGKKLTFSSRTSNSKLITGDFLRLNIGGGMVSILSFHVATVKCIDFKV